LIDQPQRPELLLHPPARLPAGHGPMGLNRWNNPVEAAMPLWGVGRLPRAEEGKTKTDPRPRCRSWRGGSPPSRLDPPPKPAGSTSTPCWQDRVAEGRLRRGDPAGRRTTSARAAARTCSWSRTGRSARRAPDRPASLDGINRASVIADRVMRPSGGGSGNSPVPLWLRRGVSLTGTAAELTPVPWRSTTVSSALARASSRARSSLFDDALHGRDPRYAEWLDVVTAPAGVPSKA